MSRAARYRPGGITAARWDRISSFCLEAVTDANPGAADISRDWMLFVGRLVDWAHNTMGMPLDRDRIFHPMTIDSFISHNAPETWTPGTKGDGRARLMRVAEAVVSYSVRPHRLAPLTRGEPSRPYAADDVRLLVLWASWQNTPEKRQSARALVGLGLGAGLSAAEVADLRVRDVHVDEHGVLVHLLGVREREVPVLADWERWVADLVGGQRADAFLFEPGHSVHHKNLVTNFIDRTVCSAIRPNSFRLRATWIVTHLLAGTPVQALATAAGVKHVDALVKYLKWVPEVDVGQVVGLYRAALRDPSPDAFVDPLTATRGRL